MSIYSFSPFGYEGSIVRVEADLRKGIPCVDIVGLSDGCIAGTRARVISAIKNQGFKFWGDEGRVLISLDHADLKKEGAGFDLPAALSILAGSGDMPRNQDAKVLIMGELDLNGNVLPVKGIYAALLTARSEEIKYAIIPENTEAVPDGIIVKRVSNLREAFTALFLFYDAGSGEIGDYGREYNEVDSLNIEFNELDGDETSLDDIRGMNGLKYAMAVAVAGRHHIMAWGSPGCGKTMMFQMMYQLMPKLLPEEQTSVQRIHSITGLLGPNQKLTTRPFRMPHQTASIEGMFGGGAGCRPGEVSLAHNGVLFLDETAEFKSSVLQMLRVPLESGSISLSRAGRTAVYPAKFQLAMAVNPCPCGNLGNPDKACLCSAREVDSYWKKFSNPLLDRVGIRFDCNALGNTDEYYNFHSLETLRQMIKQAWERQYKRQGKLNQDLDIGETEKYLRLSADAKAMLDKVAEETCLQGKS